MLFIDEASEGAYDWGAVYVGVDKANVLAAEVPFCVVFAEDMVVMCWTASLLKLKGSDSGLDDEAWRR